ncbi:MAG TPA: DNA recombination/repair protein RecA, partial [Archangium sp.]
KFYASVRCEIRRAGNIKEGDTVVGTHTKVKVVKNKVAPPFQEAEFDILYNKGINRAGEVLDLGSTLNLFEKSGSWYALNGERIAQGRAQAMDWLREHPAEFEALAQKIVSMKPLETPPPPAEEPVGEAA